ncbi:MAG: diguanylate cyclase [Alishewanella aestuarii]
MDILTLAMVNLFIEGTAADEALKVAERLRQHIENSIIDEVPALKLTVSIGISTLVSGQNFHELVQQADQALYSAKQQGRNQSLHFQAANRD